VTADLYVLPTDDFERCYQYARFPKAMISPLNLLKNSAWRVTCFSRSSSLTNPLTNQKIYTYVAFIHSPKRSISKALFWQYIAGTSVPLSVVQNNPYLTPCVEKDDLVLAITRSQLAMSWQPAAAASPLTTVINRMSSLDKVNRVSAHILNY
jgi:hypothetical protein